MKIFDRYLDGYCNAHVQVWDYLRDRTLASLADGMREKEVLTAEGIAERGRRVREAFLESIGGLPPQDTPLNARTVGILARPGYHIEKVIFESQPKVYVTALLYIPDVMELPAPGILFVCGHGREAKAFLEYQRVCHDIAINGMVALAIDPTGQGERVTTLDPETRETSHGWGTTEHSYQGQQCILTGTSLARYFLHDALRGIDYLQSRPEVDPKRIGITGNSGGGTQTTLVCMSGDDRIKAAAPCTYVTSREAYWITGQPQDAEQIQFGMTWAGINYDDMYYPIAPRPLMIGAVRSDFFSPEGTHQTYERLRKAYALLGHEKDIELVWAPGNHSYNAGLREGAVNFFRRHLLGALPDFKTAGDEAIATLEDQELWCTAKGHVLTAFPDARTPYHLNLERLGGKPASPDPARLPQSIMEVLVMPRRTPASELFSRTIRTQESEGVTVESVFFVSEPGVMVSGALAYKGEAVPDTGVVYLAEGGTAAIDDRWSAVRELATAGQAVFLFDVRGTGAVQSDPISAHGDAFPGSFFNTDAWFSWAAYMLRDNLVGMRVFDVLRAVDYLGTRGCRTFHLRAEGLEPALWGYLAAALNADITHTTIDGLIESFDAVARTQFYRRDIAPPMLIHGVLQRFDLPDLRVLFEGRTLELKTVPVAETT